MKGNEMTRINCIDPSLLTDRHLLGEWKEITRPVNKARPPKRNEKFPESYRMGKGHETFFFDKLEYIEKRCGIIAREMRKRGFNVDVMSKLKAFNKAGHRLDLHWVTCYNNWHPTSADRAINYRRIIMRLWQEDGGFVPATTIDLKG